MLVSQKSDFSVSDLALWTSAFIIIFLNFILSRDCFTILNLDLLKSFQRVFNLLKFVGVFVLDSSLSFLCLPSTLTILLHQFLFATIIFYFFVYFLQIKLLLRFSSLQNLIFSQNRLFWIGSFPCVEHVWPVNPHDFFKFIIKYIPYGYVKQEVLWLIVQKKALHQAILIS